MPYPEIVQAALNYIEKNLKASITAEDLAQQAHYSTYHFHRLFSSVMGTSIASHVLKRRLDHALAEIAKGRKAIDVVLEYGFDTYAGFYKAFVKMYGCSPKRYLTIYQHHQPSKPEVVHMYSEKELRQILSHWNIDKSLPLVDIYIQDGAKVSGKVWSVGSDYILKACDYEKMMKNIRIAKALYRQGFSSPLPIPTSEGNEYVEAGDFFILTRGIKGTPLPKSLRFGKDRVQFGEQYGRSIARLHKALKAIQNDMALDEVNLYNAVVEWALPSVKQQNLQWNMGLEDSFFSDYTVRFAALFDQLPKQLIHRDPNPSNILFDNDKVSGFIDFDLSEVNIRLWDVCYCATGILSEAGDEAPENWLDILGGILHGYDTEAKLTLEEKQAVFYVICSIQMICIAYFESQDKLKELAKTNRKMLKYIVQCKDRIQRIFDTH